MKQREIVLWLLAGASVALAAGYGLYQAGLRHGKDTVAAAPRASQPEKKVLYWHDPMTPGQKFDKPGKSPFMDMQLVPVYADNESSGGDTGGISVSPRVQQNLGIRSAVVEWGTLAAPVLGIGTVAWNERAVALVQARANGYVEHLYVRASLDPVRQGQPLAELYVPEWVAAQEEYLALKRQGDNAGGLLDAARQRMRLAGMTEQQMRSVDANGKVQAHVTLTAPISGVVGELNAREGMTIATGAALFRINGIGTVWLDTEVPEAALAQVRPGVAAEAHAPALPGVVFKGTVSAVLPEVNPTTRTVKARIELANPAGQLIPGMFASVGLRTAARHHVLLVPSEALIRTGTRSVVMLAAPDGTFQPVEVETGAEADGKTEIRKGLEAGQRVVSSGQFLVDSEASLKGSITRMGSMDDVHSETPRAVAAPKGGRQ